MIGVIDYGMGNLMSVKNALTMLGKEVELCQTPASLSEYDRLILPGVGAFQHCMEALNARGFVEALSHQVIEKRKPILGICVGMQMMVKRSYENGVCDGLDWFDAEVIRLSSDRGGLKVPHVGWNNINYREEVLFSGLPESPDFYFVHSYHVRCSNPDEVVATCDYGGEITAAIKKNNIFATQFHPEKSQRLGLSVLSNFINWEP